MSFQELTLLLLLAILVAATDDWTSQCGKCKCIWVNGRRTADCKYAHLSEIPKLSSEIREIDFSYNSLYELRTYAFSSVDFNDIHKLRLQNCSIESVHKTAFANLGLLIELDLSKNEIKKLDTATFRDNSKLRVLYLNDNKLKELQDGLFNNMSHLQRVEIKNNLLEFVGAKVFAFVPSLLNIDIGNNRLKHVESDFIENLNRLSSLNVQNNPWTCDCHLQKFKDLAMERTLVTAPTQCAEPERLKGRLWSELRSEEFACVPQIEEPTQNKQIAVDVTNFTISCKVIGNPIPDVDWVSNGRIIDRDPRQSYQKYSTAKNQVGNTIWSNLTIINVTYRDRGEYKCIAKNPGGVDERNVSLIVRGDYSGGVVGTPSGMGSAFPFIIGLSVGAVLLLLIILILVCCCCKKNSRENHVLAKGSDMSQSREYIGLDGRPEMEKALITEVNPVVKPPRQYSVPPSVTSGATEVSEVKKILLDDDSVFAGDDESRSFDFESKPPHKSQNLLDVDYHPYPPDLLSFPPCTAQVSPAGSSASTVADQSRLPQHHGPQSPIHSPIYDTASLYRTLPYSRSHSPFTSPLGVPVVAPRQGGYVTIPRRPRASWSSEPPPLTPLGEPVYDNLGLRTTATGSSVLSLNKIGAETPRATRLVPPPTPVYTSMPCDTIIEHDSPPTAATLPRSFSAHRASDSIRNSWTRNAPETSSLRSYEYPDSRRESTASLLPTPDGKITKIPPRPPPKPKKRASAGPLFEDEGEDGTEV